jgi:hypothetical protein
MRGAAQNEPCEYGYSDKKLEIFNMPVTQRCNYAGSLGKSIPTRSYAFTFALVAGCAPARRAAQRG